MGWPTPATCVSALSIWAKSWPSIEIGTTAEAVYSLGIGVDIPAQFGGAALAEAVHIDDSRQVVQPVIGRFVERLPHGPFCHLTVTAKYPDAEWQLVQITAGEGDADTIGEPLAEGTGSNVDPRQDRRGMPL